jgi:hypothetical protein
VANAIAPSNSSRCALVPQKVQPTPLQTPSSWSRLAARLCSQSVLASTLWRVLQPPLYVQLTKRVPLAQKFVALGGWADELARFGVSRPFQGRCGMWLRSGRPDRAVPLLCLISNLPERLPDNDAVALVKGYAS